MPALRFWDARLLAIGAGLVMSSSAFAQTSSAAAAPPQPGAATALAATTAQVQTVPPQTTGPTFWLFGVPIRPSAPVPPPYQGTAFEDLGGQPMTSVDQVMSQQFTGEDR